MLAAVSVRIFQVLLMIIRRLLMIPMMTSSAIITATLTSFFTVFFRTYMLMFSPVSAMPAGAVRCVLPFRFWLPRVMQPLISSRGWCIWLPVFQISWVNFFIWSESWPSMGWAMMLLKWVFLVYPLVVTVRAGFNGLLIWVMFLFMRSSSCFIIAIIFRNSIIIKFSKNPRK